MGRMGKWACAAVALLGTALAWAPAVAEAALGGAANAGGAQGDLEPFYVSLEVQHADKSEGLVTLKVEPAWAPIGAAHFKKLVEAGFYDDACFFRVIKGFMAQIGIPADPKTAAPWRDPIPDDHLVAGSSNVRGFVSYATSGPNSRTYQIFFNFGNNARLDGQGFTPFAVVERGMEVVDALHVTGEGQPGGPGPSQAKLSSKGNAYLKKNFPKVSCIKKATLAYLAPRKEILESSTAVASTISSPVADSAAAALETDKFSRFGFYEGSGSLSGSVSVFLFVVTVCGTLVACFKLNASKSKANRDLDA